MICGRIRIVGPQRALRAKRQLVVAVQHADVIVGSEDCASCRASEGVDLNPPVTVIRGECGE